MYCIGEADSCSFVEQEQVSGAGVHVDEEIGRRNPGDATRARIPFRGMKGKLIFRIGWGIRALTALRKCGVRAPPSQNHFDFGDADSASAFFFAPLTIINSLAHPKTFLRKLLSRVDEYLAD
jgi:hypothetical protein